MDIRREQADWRQSWPVNNAVNGGLEAIPTGGYPEKWAKRNMSNFRSPSYIINLASIDIGSYFFSSAKTSDNKVIFSSIPEIMNFFRLLHPALRTFPATLSSSLPIRSSTWKRDCPCSGHPDPMDEKWPDAVAPRHLREHTSVS